MLDEIKDETVEVEFKGIVFKIKMSDYGAYKPKGYSEIEELLEKYQIMPYRRAQEALIEFLLLCPHSLLIQIKEISQDPDNNMLILRVEGNSILLKEKTTLASLKSGWYYYITGVNYINIKSKKLTHLKEKISQNKNRKIQPLIKNGSNLDITPDDIQIQLLVDCSWMHAFELQVKEKRILMDCGFTFNPNHLFDKNTEVDSSKVSNTISTNNNQINEVENKLNKLKNYLLLNPPNWLIISHVHKDHTAGLVWMLKEKKVYEKIEYIFCTKYSALTILNAILHEKSLKDKFIKKIYPVSFRDSINISNNVKVQFFSAGHMVGAISTLFSIQLSKNFVKTHKEFRKRSHWRFLYTSDFCLDVIPPIESFSETLRKFPKVIDFAILDGAREQRKIHSLEDQLENLYQESVKTWQQGGTVIISTDEHTYSPIIFMKFYQKNRNTKFPVPIYIDPDILDCFSQLSLCYDDLDNTTKSQIINKRNPFQSWQIQPLNNIRTSYEALSQPSLIITYPNEISKKPLSDIFPLLAMDPKNLMVFALYLNKNDEITWNFVKNDPTTIEHYTNLNGILNKRIPLQFNPKCRIFNQIDAYRKYTFQNHANDEQFKILRKKITILREYLFHKGEIKVLKLLYP
ncbi:MAG: hypothetical protein K9W44_00540 [Candidatus Lokiarchaeota archaeon]|nr:hypothetical protein [Candidatus Harpocratesius repetitus]